MLPPTFARCDRRAVLFRESRWIDLGAPREVRLVHDGRDLLVLPVLDGRGLKVGQTFSAADDVWRRVQTNSLRDVLPGVYRTRMRDLGVCRALAIIGCGAFRSPSLTPQTRYIP